MKITSVSRGISTFLVELQNLLSLICQASFGFITQPAKIEIFAKFFYAFCQSPVRGPGNEEE